MIKSTTVKPATKPSTKLPSKTKNNTITTTPTPTKKTPVPTKPSEKPTPKPVVKDPPNPVEEKPVKPVKEAAKAIDTKVMKEKKEKDAQNDISSALKVNGAKPATNKPASDPKGSAKMDEKDILFTWTPKGAEKVQITGTFNNWKEKLDMKPVGDKHELSIPLKPGKYCYKFIVDGEWCYDFTSPNEGDDDGNVNNVITV